MKFLFSFLCLTFVLTGCTSYFTRVKKADIFAYHRGIKKELVQGQDFWITTYQKIKDPTKAFVFYIEGDGPTSRRMPGGYRKPTKNPTPSKLITLQLAYLDERESIPNVVYLAQPCQYTSFTVNKLCGTEYWTRKKMAPEVVESLNDVINSIAGDSPVHLIGYSGGGGLAILIAAHNPNVKSIITIAGMLDRTQFNKYHKLTSDADYSLDPLNYVSAVSKIPQMHLSGARDDIIPPFIATAFVEASNSECVKQKIISKAKHDGDEWVKIWLGFISQLPLAFN